MNDLRRSLAPISAEAWEEIDAGARRVLELNLAGRKIVDFSGPQGWTTSAVNLGRTESLKKGPAEGVDALVRRVQPLVEIRSAFELSRVELENVGRGAKDADLDSLIDAAKRFAAAEDVAVFHGYGDGSIRGIVEASTHTPLTISDDYRAYPQTVAEAMRVLKMSGVDGPYAIALGPRCYQGLMQATGPAGFPVYEQVRRILDGPVVWAPAIRGAVVISLRNGDFVLTVGQDASIGYDGHTDTTVRLYFVESFTFRVLTPEAAVPLAYQE